ncbi:MAG: hypothetical protein EB084_05080 [Proteobacteria bacterium]|nr:hypothetical protein [Pseudomonadota bacterium]
MRIIGAILLACLAALVVWGTRPGVVSTGPPNVVLVGVDGLDTRVMGTYGSPTSQTPFIDGLAREGTVFLRHVPQSDEARYGYASMLSSRYPSEIAPLISAQFKVSVDTLTLPRVLHTYGYRTVIVGDASALGADPVAELGFDRAALVPITADFTARATRLTEIVRDLEPPVAAVLQTADATRGPDGVKAADSGLRVLLEQLRERRIDARNTLVGVVGARAATPTGEALRIGGDALRAPLIWWGRDVRAGTSQRDISSGLDILPTVFAQTGIALPRNVRGADRSSSLRGSPIATAPWWAVIENDQQTAVITDTCALAASGVPPGSARLVALLESRKPSSEALRAYALTADRSTPLAIGAGPATELMQDLRFVASQGAGVRLGARPAKLSPELQKSLHDHGYW